MKYVKRRDEEYPDYCDKDGWFYLWGFKMKEKNIFWLTFTSLIIIGIALVSFFSFNSEPTHTQTITEVKEVNAKVNIDMINQTADLNMAVDMILNAKHQLERLEND